MNIPLEFHIKRKQKMLNTLYYSQDPFTLSDLAKKLDTSESTLKNDLQKCNLIGEDGCIVTNIDKDTRMSLHNTIMTDSLFGKVFRLLLMNNGKQAHYYSSQLSMSRANFYKQVILLNNALCRYGGKIAVNDGYHIFATHEMRFRIFVFFYLVATHTESSDELISLYSPISRILNKNQLHFAHVEDTELWEDTYQCALFSIFVIRQSDPVTKCEVLDYEAQSKKVKLTKGDLSLLQSELPNVTKQTVIEALIQYRDMIESSKSLVSKKKMKEILDQYETHCSLCFKESLSAQQLDTLRQIMSIGVYLYELFPFNISGLSLTISDFFREFTMINDELIQNFDHFLSIASKNLNVDLSLYRNLLFYWVVINVGDFLFIPKKKILFLSRYYNQHLQFTNDKLVELLRIMKIDPEIVIAHENDYKHELRKNKYDLIMSDTMIDNDPKIIHFPFSNGVLVVASLFNQLSEINNNELCKEVFD